MNSYIMKEVLSMSKYRIIAFDGGGIRGALSITLLRRLWEKLPYLIRTTNLFAGTSTGSFIALGLAKGLKAVDLAKLYSEENGKAIFSPKSFNPFRPVCKNNNLKKILSEIFPSSLRLKDLKHRVLVTSFEVDDCISQSWNPIFLNNFPYSKTQYEYAIDAALSSSAVPILFPSHGRNIDGGIVAGNPSPSAIALAVDKNAGKQKIEDICLLSIGTGYNALKIKSDTSKWGVIQWSLKTFPSPPLLNLMLDGAVEADTLFSSQLLGDKYFRLNPELEFPIAMTDYKKMPYLIELAEKVDLTNTIDWIKSNWS